MSECKTEGSCAPKNSCDTAAPASSECTMAEDLFCLGKEAWMDLLKEKMMKNIEAKMGKQMDKIADVVVEANMACFKHKMAEKEGCNSYKEQLWTAMKG